MKFKYEDLEDKRINAKRPFWKEFLIIFGIVLICSAGEVLIFNQQMMDHASPWIMALVGMSYVLFVGLLVSLGVVRQIKSTTIRHFILTRIAEKRSNKAYYKHLIRQIK